MKIPFGSFLTTNEPGNMTKKDWEVCKIESEISCSEKELDNLKYAVGIIEPFRNKRIVTSFGKKVEFIFWMALES